MKRIINSQVLFALLLIAAAPLAATAQVTTYFTDNFSYGSTTNGPSIRGGDPTTSFTSYDIAASKNTIPGTNGCTITPNDFHLALLAATASGFLEAQALFVTNSLGGTNAIALAEPGDYIDVVVVFTNTAGLLIVHLDNMAWFIQFRWQRPRGRRPCPIRFDHRIRLPLCHGQLPELAGLRRSNGKWRLCFQNHHPTDAKRVGNNFRKSGIVCQQRRRRRFR